MDICGNDKTDLKIISIGCEDTITKKPKYFERLSSEPESGQQLVDSFLEHVMHVYEAFQSTIDPALHIALGKLKKLVF